MSCSNLDNLAGAAPPPRLSAIIWSRRAASSAGTDTAPGLVARGAPDALELLSFSLLEGMMLWVWVIDYFLMSLNQTFHKNNQSNVALFPLCRIE
jgi:hypothetical protein